MQASTSDTESSRQASLTRPNPLARPVPGGDKYEQLYADRSMRALVSSHDLVVQTRAHVATGANAPEVSVERVGLHALRMQYSSDVSQVRWRTKCALRSGRGSDGVTRVHCSGLACEQGALSHPYADTFGTTLPRYLPSSDSEDSCRRIKSARRRSPHPKSQQT